MLFKAPDVLLADFQHYYQIDLQELGENLTVRRAADLAAHLPVRAAIWQRIDERARWTDMEYLLAEIVDATSFLAWTKTKAASKGGKWSGGVQRPGTQNNKHSEKTGAMDVENLLLTLYGHRV